ncbi:MAG: hypothetical protein NTW86_16525, partial [Candidatus Sumerlaeota bacterium]|nr:hypothetical protein [Candidatus Sumerlaeota bacterium]
VWWNSPDSYHVFAGGMYSYEQAKVHASFCSIAGNFVQMAEPLADEQIPPDRLDMIRRVAPTTPDTSTAVDVFEHNPAQLWNLPIHRPFGDWNIVGLFNFDYDQKGTPLTQTIDLEKDLLLSPDKDYLAYEYWTRRFLGTVRGAFARTVPAPDCEIFSIVEKQDHPVLVSTNRHVRQMAYDIRDLKWDPKGRTLEGASRVVRNDPYELRLYLPAGYFLSETEVEGLEAKTKTEGELAFVEFTSPQSGDVKWKATFASR